MLHYIRIGKLSKTNYPAPTSENRDHSPRFSSKLSDHCSYEAEKLRFISFMVCKHSVKSTTLYLDSFFSYCGHRWTDGFALYIYR